MRFSPPREFMSLEQALAHLLAHLGDELGDAGGARFRVFAIGKAKMLKPEIQEQICLIAREALINAGRHSKATSIEAEVQYLPRRLRVLVRDNGCGIDPKSVQWDGDANGGLTGMRDRALRLEARLKIRSRRGAGTEVELLISGRCLAEAYL